MVSYASFMENELIRGKGRIEIILGPMFSGKTTELIRRIRRYQLARFKCLVLKYTGDCRYSKNDVATHDFCTFDAISCSSLEDCRSQTMEFDVIGIDEGQFFCDLISFCENLANKGKIVIIAALDGTYQRTAFGDILKLVPLAESVIKLNAICMLCYNTAGFTKRITNEKAVELIGGADKYMAVCRECYHLKRASSKGDKSPLKPINQNNQ
ncbi:hypothetical protein RUM44_006816 [Polyplax serrata]|uniref:Thymidine kinase n=1 Tax=Polyplax serrata TaxID=468196 RepID=A0ABR1AJ72_POLSC